MGARRVYFTTDQERMAEALGIRNLSAYVRHKMEEDVQAIPARRKAQVADLREQLKVAESALETTALAQDDGAIRQFSELADKAQKNLTHNGGLPVQTTLRKFIQHNPDGQKLRALLPEGLNEGAVVDLLERWPLSKPDVIQLITNR